MNNGEDPRAVANFVLDVASQIGLTASNLTLNKIAYFLHGAYLARYDKPLIDARIEAWDYGPVIREIYHEFKAFKDKPVLSRAKRINRDSGDKEVCEYTFPEDEYLFLFEVTSSYLKLRPGTLVDLSHVYDGPWHEVWFHDGRVNPGMEISDDLIQKHFREKERH